jgi:DNA polymerase-3 subunit delta'
MNLAAALETARQGRLYPAVILHGGDGEGRRRAAGELARTLLCEAPAQRRPCGACRHCRRIDWPGEPGDAAARRERGEMAFHPDFQVLERDLKASTSVDATRELLRGAQVSPFEARGQVFVVASAESLTGEAANALLKSLEEPHVTAPRHFLLLAPSRLDLLPTLRSRSLAVFLGPALAVDPALDLAAAFAAAADAYAETGAALHLLRAAEALAAVGAAGAAGAAGASGGKGSGDGGWDDPRSGRPWALAAAAVVRSLPPLAPRPAPRPSRRAARAPRLALAEALLGGPAMRMRGISADRILEGLVARHLCHAVC